MYYEVPVLLRFETTTPLTLEQVRDFLQGQPAAPRPCEILLPQDPEVPDPTASWVQNRTWEAPGYLAGELP